MSTTMTGQGYPRGGDPRGYEGAGEEYHEKLIEHVAEQDDELMEKYLDGEDHQRRDQGCIRKSTIATDGSRDLRHLLQEQGRSEAAGCHCDYMPSSDGCPAIKGTNPETGEEEDPPSPPTTSRSQLWPSRS